MGLDVQLAAHAQRLHQLVRREGRVLEVLEGRARQDHVEALLPDDLREPVDVGDDVDVGPRLDVGPEELARVRDPVAMHGRAAGHGLERPQLEHRRCGQLGAAGHEARLEVRARVPRGGRRAEQREPPQDPLPRPSPRPAAALATRHRPGIMPYVARRNARAGETMARAVLDSAPRGVQHGGPGGRQGRHPGARRGLARDPDALPRPGRLRQVHARADVHAAVRRAGRRRPVHDRRARDQQAPERTEELAGNALDAATAALDRGHLPGLGDQPAAALRPRRARGDRARRRPAAVRDADQLAGDRAAGAPGHGPGRGRRRARTRRHARAHRARGRARPRLLRRDAEPPRVAPPRRSWSPGCSRSHRPDPLPRATSRSGARCCWRASRSAWRSRSTRSTSAPTR